MIQLKVGTPVVANSFSQENMIGMIILASPYSRDGYSTYKIEWCDGFINWYSHAETDAYAQKARRLLNREDNNGYSSCL